MTVKFTPVLDAGCPTQPTIRPVPEKPDRKSQLWSFSFRFWRQGEYFGLDKTDTGWFVSVFEKLSALSREKVGDFLCDRKSQDTWRYHKVNWNQENIPIQRRDLHWLDADYRENNDDFPLVQFQISTSLGRVIGFWDEKNVFNIVLFDPLHNMQPTKSTGYRVDPCGPLPCHYSSLLNALDSLRPQCEEDGCARLTEALAANDKRRDLERFNVVYVKLDDNQAYDMRAIFESGKAATFSDIIAAGITVLS